MIVSVTQVVGQGSKGLPPLELLQFCAWQAVHVLLTLVLILLPRLSEQ